MVYVARVSLRGRPGRIAFPFAVLGALSGACGSGVGSTPADSGGATAAGGVGSVLGGGPGNPGSGGGPAAGGSPGSGATSGTVSSAGVGGSAASGNLGGVPSGGNGSGGAATFPPVPTSPPLCTLSASCSERIEDEPKVLCTFSVSDGFGVPVFDDHAGFELRGRTSQAYPKVNYSIELCTSDGAETSVDFFGMGGDADWILDGSWADRSFIRNDLVFDVFRSARLGNYAPECQYCTLTLNGQPQGIYRLCERIKRDDDRLDLSPDDGTGKSFVIKQDDEGDLYFGVGIQDEFKLVYPNEESATGAQIEGIQSWLDGLRAALDGSNPDDATTGIFAYLDIEVTLDYILLEELSKNIDGYNLSLHFAKDLAGKGQLVPWDLDLSMGQPTVQGEDNESPEGWIANRTDLVTALQATEAMRSGLGPRWRDLRSGPLSDASVNAWIDSYLLTLTPEALAANFSIWPIEDVDFSQIYRPYALYPVATHAEEITRLRAWIAGRLAWIDANIDDFPR